MQGVCAKQYTTALSVWVRMISSRRGGRQLRWKNYVERDLTRFGKWAENESWRNYVGSCVESATGNKNRWPVLRPSVTARRATINRRRTNDLCLRIRPRYSSLSLDTASVDGVVAADIGQFNVTLDAQTTRYQHICRGHFAMSFFYIKAPDVVRNIDDTCTYVHRRRNHWLSWSSSLPAISWAGWDLSFSLAERVQFSSCQWLSEFSYFLDTAFLALLSLTVHTLLFLATSIIVGELKIGNNLGFDTKNIQISTHLRNLCVIRCIYDNTLCVKDVVLYCCPEP